MNERAIWSLWHTSRLSTAEIARRTKEQECDVDRLILACRECHRTHKPMPFSKESA